jgi:hypothetical protein
MKGMSVLLGNVPAAHVYQSSDGGKKQERWAEDEYPQE